MLSQTFQWHGCAALRIQSSNPLHFSAFNRIIIVHSFIKCDRLVSASFLELCALESWHTVRWSKKTDVSDTLCDPHPPILFVGYVVRG